MGATTRREDLLAAAVRVFSQKGYGASSVDAVAKEADIRKPSVYKHVRSKEDLLMAILDCAHHQSIALWEEVARLEAPPIERLREFLERHVRWYLEDVELLNVFFNEWRSLTTPATRALIAERRRTYDRQLRRLVQECQDSGDADPGLDPKYVSFFVLGAVNATPGWFRHHDPDDTPELVARDTAALVVHMIAPRVAA